MTSHGSACPSSSSTRRHIFAAAKWKRRTVQSRLSVPNKITSESGNVRLAVELTTARSYEAITSVSATTCLLASLLKPVEFGCDFGRTRRLLTQIIEQTMGVLDNRLPHAAGPPQALGIVSL